MTICDAVDISIHTRIPLPGIEAAFTKALTCMGEQTATHQPVPHVPPSPPTMSQLN